MSPMSSFTHLSDTDLLVQAKTLAANERRATAQLIAALAELDARRLYLPQGCRSMFTYCTEILHLSESAAYARIEAARAARRFPGILHLLDDGAITLTTVGLLAAHLTEDNHERLLASATHQSKRQVEALVAALTPQAPVPAVVRKLPSRAVIDSQSPLIADADRPPAPTAGVDGQHAEHLAVAAVTAVTAAVPPTAAVAAVKPHTSAKPAVVAPLSPDRYKLQLTMSRETHDKLRRVQDLMRHTNPTGDPAVIFDRAITMLLNSLEKAKVGATDRPRKRAPASPGTSQTSGRSGQPQTSGQAGTSRHIPTAVKRAVWRRDGGRCAFVGDAGRCTETGCLEYHHVVPFAEGGPAVESNIELRCRAHNAHEAERWFGPLVAREEHLVYTGFTGSGLTGSGPDPVNSLRVWTLHPRHSIPGPYAFDPSAP